MPRLQLNGTTRIGISGKSGSVFPNGLIDGVIEHRHFRVTSGNGYIDMTATLDVIGNLATTRMWVEEGIVYEADLWLDLGGSRSADPSEVCYSIIFDSPALDSPGENYKLSDYGEVNGIPKWSCPGTVTITAQDEIQLNASDGTFADHVRITWNEMQGATGTRYSDARAPSIGLSVVTVKTAFVVKRLGPLQATALTIPVVWMKNPTGTR